MAASGSALSRRVSEVVGVALFASALIWLIALATYDANDPVWFFSTGTHDVPANFAGRVGAFLGELSYQVLGYASYLIPAVIAVAGWHYFWCRAIDAVYTKVVGALMLFACGSAFLGLTLGRVEFGPRAFRAGGYLGEWLGGFMSEYLSRTGSVIVILALMVAAVILATQFSFGRLFSVMFSALSKVAAQGTEAFTLWREERRKAQQRREVMVKYGKNDAPVPGKADKKAPKTEKAADSAPGKLSGMFSREKAAPPRGDEPAPAPAAAPPPVVQKRAPNRTPVSAPLPLPEPERVERRLGS